MRLIDADVLIERWNNMSVRGRTEFDQEIMVAPSIDFDDYVPREFHDKTCEEMARRHQAEIAELTADRPQGEWIPCSERLPSEKDYIGDVVIWCTDKSMVGVGWYYESTESWATIDDTFPPILGEVIAWMPLPKPWKGADDE